MPDSSLTLTCCSKIDRARQILLVRMTISDQPDIPWPLTAIPPTYERDVPAPCCRPQWCDVEVEKFGETRWPRYLSYLPRAKLSTPAFAARQIAGYRMGTDRIATLTHSSNVCAFHWHGATLWLWTSCTNLHRAYINRFTKPIKGRSLPLQRIATWVRMRRRGSYLEVLSAIPRNRW